MWFEQQRQIIVPLNKFDVKLCMEWKFLFGPVNKFSVYSANDENKLTKIRFRGLDAYTGETMQFFDFSEFSSWINVTPRSWYHGTEELLLPSVHNRWRVTTILGNSCTLLKIEIDKVVCWDVGWNIWNLLRFRVFVLPMFVAFLSLLVGMSTVHYNIGDGCWY